MHNKIHVVTMMLILLIGLYNLQIGFWAPKSNHQKKVEAKLAVVGILDPSMAEAVIFASKRTSIEENLLIALMFTESSGNSKAVSSKGYNGLMQIPQEVFYPDANILIGAHILKEKLRLTKYDLYKSILWYKGFKNQPERGRKHVLKALSIYHKLKEHDSFTTKV